MSILDNILEDFFNDLKENEEVPNDVIDEMKELIENENFSSSEFLKIIGKK